MKELQISELDLVSGGNPIVKEIGKWIIGGAVWDSIKAASSHALRGTARVSSGGQMNRTRRFNALKKNN